MAWHEVNLNDLLGCARRELAFRQRCYPKWVDKGTMTEKKAEKELELMRSLCDFLVHCVFKAVTRAKYNTGMRASDDLPTSAEEQSHQNVNQTVA